MTRSRTYSTGSTPYRVPSYSGALVSFIALFTRRVLGGIILLGLLGDSALGQSPNAAAEKQAVEDGNREYAKGTAESRQTALGDLQQALSIARQLNDKSEEALILWSIGSTYYFLDQKTLTLDY